VNLPDKRLNPIDIEVLNWRDFIPREDAVHLGLYSNFPPLTVMHRHDFFEVFVILEGSLVHRLEGEISPLLGRGSLVFIRPDDVHGFARHETESCTMANLAFTPATLEAISHFTGLTFHHANLLESKHPPTIQLPENEIDPIAARLSTLFAQASEAGNASLRALLAQWLAEIAVPLHGSQTDSPSWLIELCAAMKRKENFLQGVGRLQELASRSPEHVARSFKRYLGTTPSTFVNNLRLGYAGELLADESLPVIEVALEAGFSEPGYFNRLFKRRYQCTPRTFRARCRNTLP